jgi:hypothetical protein
MMAGALRRFAAHSTRPGRLEARRKALAVAVSLLALAGLGGDALAQSCNALRAELARLQSGVSAADARQAARYERAWREQAAVLARTRDEARRAGCFGGGFLFFQARPQPVCRTLVPKLQQMEANLGQLERLYDRHARAASDARQMEQIRTVLERGACSDGGGFFARLFGRGDPYEEEISRLPGYGGPWREDGRLYRTLCVRTCDGYYFPISFSTTAARFGTDRQICQAMCPGTQVELYYHRDPTADADTMMSVAGQPYSQLPNAFRYRKELDPACSCGKPQAVQVALVGQGLGPAEEAFGRRQATKSAAPLPRARGLPAEDPETLANRAGGYGPRPVAARAGPIADTGAWAVRVVGPAYWGSRQLQDEVLIAPLPN